MTTGILNFFPLSQGFDITLVNLPLCRVIWFFRVFGILNSAYFQTFISIDRAINVLYPRRYIWLTKPLNLFKITFVLSLSVGLYCILPASRSLKYTQYSVGNETLLKPTSCFVSDYKLKIYNISYVLVRMISFISILISNVVIIRRLFTSKQNLKAPKNSTSSSVATYSSKELAFAFNLLASNIILFLIVSPFIGSMFFQLSYLAQSNPSADYVAFANLFYTTCNWGRF